MYKVCIMIVYLPDKDVLGQSTGCLCLEVKSGKVFISHLDKQGYIRPDQPIEVMPLKKAVKEFPKLRSAWLKELRNRRMP